MYRSTNRSRAAGPEIWFQIVHAAVPSQDGAPLVTFREQEVEVALGPVGVIEDGQVGILTRRIEVDWVVSVVPLTRGNFKPPTAPKTPRVTDLLRKAIEWRRQIDVGEVHNQAAVARREGITRARVTQILDLLRLAPVIQEHVLAIPDAVRRPRVSERMLRTLETVANHLDQLQRFHTLMR